MMAAVSYYSWNCRQMYQIYDRGKWGKVDHQGKANPRYADSVRDAFQKQR